MSKRSSQEEWERKKSYLIRSLFENRPLLSPVIETQEPEPVEPNPHLDGHESPLPDLIIEPISKRNLYDEPDEFYIALEKEMRRLYRRDFLNTDSKSNSDNYDEEEDIGTLEREHFNVPFDIELQKSHRSLETKSMPNKSTEIIEKSEVLRTRNTSSRTMHHNDIMSQTFTERNTSPSGSDASDEDVYEEVTFQAELHKEMDSHDIIEGREIQESHKTGLRYASSLSSVILPAGTNTDQVDVASSHSQYQEQSDVEELAEIDDARTKSSESSGNTTLPEPELMRQHQAYRSFGSFPYKDSSNSEDESIISSKSLSMEVDSTESPNVEASPNENQFAGPHFSERIHNTSTPKSSKKSFTCNSRVKKRKKRLVSYSSTFTSRASCIDTNKALQTSFSDDETELRNIFQNFFEGDVITYKLCSCDNHVCS